ncbi:AAA family ATPase [uncultured Duncaniella sp.]|uniref:McrB family protein n=1 Tax=uncultured Duncaniella sp. TaxID=2768039 RepID=UPI0025F09336|nr:AAA family ATPase [uncultured Duncaniella sp.]
MTRTDFIDCRADVIRNIHTLYSYAQSDDGDEREWAIDRYRQGRCFVVEPFGNKLMFGPSRFCGYKENTWEKQYELHGDGTETNDRYLKLKLYKQDDSPTHKIMFHAFLKEFGIENPNVKFFIPTEGDIYGPHKCYFLPPTNCRGYRHRAWKSFLDNGIAAVAGMDEDYSDYSEEDIASLYRDDEQAGKNIALLKQIRPGDMVCSTHASSGLLGIGIAVSSYKYQPSIHYAGIDESDNPVYYPHFVDVKWLCFKENGYITTEEFDIRPPEKAWPQSNGLSQTDIPKYITDYLLQSTPQPMENRRKYDRYIKLLKANRNLILTGAPGTGKTHLAKAIAEEMDAVCEFVQFHPSYDYTDFVEGLRPTPPDKNGNIGFERKDGIFKDFCKRALGKRTYSFEHFFNKLIKDIQSGRTQTLGLRSGKKSQRLRVSSRNTIKWESTKEDNVVSLDRLKQLYRNYKSVEELDAITNINNTIRDTIGGCNASYFWAVLHEILRRKEEAEHNLSEGNSSPLPHILIIDEINRGEISKIFGELFFSIDPGYRGERGRVKTQYQNLITDEDDPFYKGFYVPENVYIIGTMNDIDRSVESMDFAMRRRFAWEEIKAADNTEMLNDLGEMKDEVIEVMNRLNNAIRNDEENEGIEGLNSSFHIGAAYFAKLGLYLDDDHSNKEEAYGHLWENHLRGVLFEYLRGTINAEENLRLLESAYYGINDDNETD